VDAVDQGAGTSESVAAFDEQPRHHRLVVDGDLRKPFVRNAATATIWASSGSVLRPWPVADPRARADSFGGTSTASFAVDDESLAGVVRPVLGDPIDADQGAVQDEVPPPPDRVLDDLPQIGCVGGE
jgi:hypothetical protein